MFLFLCPSRSSGGKPLDRGNTHAAGVVYSGVENQEKLVYGNARIGMSRRQSTTSPPSVRVSTISLASSAESSTISTRSACCCVRSDIGGRGLVQHQPVSFCLCFRGSSGLSFLRGCDCVRDATWQGEIKSIVDAGMCRAHASVNGTVRIYLSRRPENSGKRAD